MHGCALAAMPRSTSVATGGANRRHLNEQKDALNRNVLQNLSETCIFRSLAWWSMRFS